MEIGFQFISNLFLVGIVLAVIAFIMSILLLMSKEPVAAALPLDDDLYQEDEVSDDELDDDFPMPVQEKPKKKGLFGFGKKKKPEEDEEDDFIDEDDEDFYEPKENYRDDFFEGVRNEEFGLDLGDEEEEEDEETKRRKRIEEDLKRIKIKQYGDDDEIETPYRRISNDEEKEEDEVMTRIQRFQRDIKNK